MGDEQKSAKARTTGTAGERTLEADASGSGVGAAAGDDYGRAVGETTAATGTVAISEAAKSLEPGHKRLLEQLTQLPAETRGLVDATLKQCLAQLLELRVEQGRMKETLDELWAKSAAKELRGNIVAEGTVKAFLESAIKSGGVGVLLSALSGTPSILPK